jgi:hypothetical protein
VPPIWPRLFPAQASVIRQPPHDDALSGAGPLPWPDSTAANEPPAATLEAAVLVNGWSIPATSSSSSIPAPQTCSVRCWGVSRSTLPTYRGGRRERNPIWVQLVRIEGKIFMLSADGELMPAKKGQAPPSPAPFRSVEVTVRIRRRSAPSAQAMRPVHLAPAVERFELGKALGAAASQPRSGALRPTSAPCEPVHTRTRHDGASSHAAFIVRRLGSERRRYSGGPS